MNFSSESIRVLWAGRPPTMLFVWPQNQRRFRTERDPERPLLAWLCARQNVVAYGTACLGFGTIADMARDTAELIRPACTPPVVVAGLSMGGLIVVQLALDAPELVRAGIAMGAAARSHGWLYYYMAAEIAYREAGGSFDGEMAVAHYAASLYPARVLGDPVLWPRIRDELTAWTDPGGESTAALRQQQHRKRCRKDCHTSGPCRVRRHRSAASRQFPLPER